MVCQGLDILTNYTITTLMQFPTTCDHFFYLKIMASLFVIMALTLYYEERARIGKADFISSLGISGIATIFISLIGTLVGFIETDIFIIIIVSCLSFVALWFFKE